MLYSDSTSIRTLLAQKLNKLTEPREATAKRPRPEMKWGDGHRDSVRTNA
jgi:hypothetical protein